MNQGNLTTPLSPRRYGRGRVVDNLGHGVLWIRGAFSDEVEEGNEKRTDEEEESGRGRGDKYFKVRISRYGD